jgi:hypothetical protein
MKIVNPLLSRRVAKALKPQNHVLLALKDRQGGGAGRHCKPRGAIRRAENMAIRDALAEWNDASQEDRDA